MLSKHLTDLGVTVAAVSLAPFALLGFSATEVEFVPVLGEATSASGTSVVPWTPVTSVNLSTDSVGVVSTAGAAELALGLVSVTAEIGRSVLRGH